MNFSTVAPLRNPKTNYDDYYYDFSINHCYRGRCPRANGKYANALIVFSLLLAAFRLSFTHCCFSRRVWALSSNSSRASSKCRRAATVRSSVPTIYDHVILTAAFCSFTTIMHREHTLSHTHTIIIMYGRVCDMVPHLFIQYKPTIFILYTYTLRNIEEGSTSWTFYQIFVVVVVTQFPCGSVVQGKPFNYTLGVFCIELKMDRTTI